MGDLRKTCLLQIPNKRTNIIISLIISIYMQVLINQLCKSKFCLKIRTRSLSKTAKDMEKDQRNLIELIFIIYTPMIQKKSI